MTAHRPSRILGPLAVAVGLACLSAGDAARGREEDLRNRAEEGMRRAAAYYRGRVASHGGYVYHESTASALLAGLERLRAIDDLL